MHLRSPLGNYKLGYEDAKDLCAENGARLATLAEINTCQQQGKFGKLVFLIPGHFLLCGSFGSAYK